MSEQLHRQYRQLQMHQEHLHQSHHQQPQHPLHWHRQHHQPLSPDRVLAALPESYMQSSTPLCSCPMQLLQQSPCSLSSSLLSFSDSSASFSSDLESRAASPQAVRVAVGRRRLRLVQREEGQLRRLVTDLDSRMQLAGGATGSGDKDLLALRRMTVEGVLHTVQVHAAAQSAEVAAAAHLTDPPRKCDSDSDSENCSLLDF